jgi:hypothetical protein
MSDVFVKVWRFEESPKEYQALSKNGGDEDWVAFIPDEMKYYWVPWLEHGTPFGCCCVDEFKVDGGMVKIGSHA